MFSAATKTGSQPSAAANYIEDVFSTYLYKGNGGTQTIANGLDESGKGALTWVKSRQFASSHCLTDTIRGVSYGLASNDSAAQSYSAGNDIYAFNSTGFGVKTGGNFDVNENNRTYCSWTFRKQPKFFDVVTYTGNGAGVRAIPHSLGTAAALTFLKKTSTTSDWIVNGNFASLDIQPLYLNLTNARDAFNQTGVLATDDTSIYVGASTGSPNFGSNDAGVTYVVYLFASNAGGFGTSGTDNVISCGSFTTDGSGNATVNLGYEPQYILIKYSSSASNWYVFDTMRGLSLTSQRGLFPNQNYAESGYTGTGLFPTATGFSTLGTSLFDPSVTCIYMAIRRPMKVPTDATTVFKPDAGTNGTSGGIVPTGFAVDMSLTGYRSLGGVAIANDRLRGFGNANSADVTPALQTSTTDAESAFSGSNPYFYNAWNTGITRGSNGANPGGAGIITWFFSRRPGFFDEVCYTGTGSATTFNHNLGVVPELMIVKERDVTGAWRVYSKSIANTDYLVLNSTGAVTTGDMWNSTTPTSTVFSIGTSYSVNRPAGTFVNYLFATCPGVSKVGSYTGNGSTQAISCGFTGGARFVLIRDINGSDWYVYDTARGMTTLTDPYLALNSTAAETATLGSVTSTAGGFTVNATILSAINTSGASYIFLAIA